MPPLSTIAGSPNAVRAQDRAVENGFVAREAWAFEAAYQSFKSLLFGAAASVLNNREDAEDTVHDVLARLWQRGHAYTTARGSLRAFLIACVRNEALSRRRKSGNRLRIEQTVRPETVVPADESLADRDRVARALDVLGEKQREVIRLAYEEGLPYAEIAQRLNEPAGTIKSRLSNAVRTLRAHFAAQGETL
jgi:RNA polymerase sigma-70 factor (ECF subfamily)